MTEKVVRSKAIGIRLDAKTHYIAQLAAQRERCTLNKFIEKAVIQALSVEAMDEEMNVAEPTGPKEPSPLWMENLWSPDEATRHFLLGLHRDLMTADQQRFLTLFTLHMNLSNRQAGLNEFREFWNSVNTKPSESEGTE
jgi:hypothetical protein